MEIKIITVREVRNLGNYQTRTAEAIGHLNEGDNPTDAMQELIKFVRDELHKDDAENPQKSELPSPIPVVKVKPHDVKDEGDIPF